MNGKVGSVACTSTSAPHGTATARAASRRATTRRRSVWWRTLPDELTGAQAQASLDAFCGRVGDTRVRKREGQRTTVGDLGEAEPLAPLPPAFPATVTAERIVSSQALLAFRGNRYSVPPGLAGATVTVSHRLGQHLLDMTTSTATSGATVLARHRREPDGAGVLVRDTVHVTALETAVLAAFDSSKPCARKVRRPPTPAALAEAEHLRSDRHVDEREVVVDLTRYAQAARDRQQAAQ